MKYPLKQIEDIIFNGFNFTVPDETMEKISNLAIQVGSPDYVKTPVFTKREERPSKNKKNSNEDWESIRTFQTTKFETKISEFDVIRSYINKITDKNYIDIRNKIIETIDEIIRSSNDVNLSQIGANIFEIASSNKYYSQIYAELYADLSSKYDFIKEKYQENFSKFMDLFNTIEYVNSNENYDKFCEINKANEKRKSLAKFYVNLMNLGSISKNEIINITRILLAKVYEYIYVENKKNEVEELTETISILYNKELYESEDINYELIEGYTINEIITKIANSKVKDFKSLTNKALFKFMDLIDM
jgi:hypothetical protein